MNSKQLVSVIMIFLDAETYICQAIESVLAQTYHRWELLLVDDGSTDASTKIAQEYAAQRSGQIRYLEHEGHQNRGMSASRNLGIREAKGEYIALLDADDVYLPQKLERQVAILDAQPGTAMVYGTSQYWYSWSDRDEDRKCDRNRTLGVPVNTLFQPPALLSLFLQNKARTPATCSVLIRRRAIEQVGGFEKQFRGMFEDQVFFYKLCLRAPVFVASGCWSRYRQHPGSWCRLKRDSGEWDPTHRPSPTRLAFLNWFERYLEEQKVRDPIIRCTLNKELWLYRHPKFSTAIEWTKQLKGRLLQHVRK